MTETSLLESFRIAADNLEPNTFVLAPGVNAIHASAALPVTAAAAHPDPRTGIADAHQLLTTISDAPAWDAPDAAVRLSVYALGLAARAHANVPTPLVLGVCPLLHLPQSAAEEYFSRGVLSGHAAVATWLLHSLPALSSVQSQVAEAGDMSEYADYFPRPHAALGPCPDCPCDCQLCLTARAFDTLIKFYQNVIDDVSTAAPAARAAKTALAAAKRALQTCTSTSSDLPETLYCPSAAAVIADGAPPPPSLAPALADGSAPARSPEAPATPIEIGRVLGVGKVRGGALTHHLEDMDVLSAAPAAVHLVSVTAKTTPTPLTTVLVVDTLAQHSALCAAAGAAAALALQAAPLPTFAGTPHALPTAALLARACLQPGRGADTLRCLSRRANGDVTAMDSFDEMAGRFGGVLEEMLGDDTPYQAIMTSYLYIESLFDSGAVSPCYEGRLHALAGAVLGALRSLGPRSALDGAVAAARGVYHTVFADAHALLAARAPCPGLSASLQLSAGAEAEWVSTVAPSAEPSSTVPWPGRVVGRELAKMQGMGSRLDRGRVVAQNLLGDGEMSFEYAATAISAVQLALRDAGSECALGSLLLTDWIAGAVQSIRDAKHSTERILAGEKH